LNRTDSTAQVTVKWEKVGLKVAPKSVHDVWKLRDIGSVDAPVSVPAHDLALLLVDGEDAPPAEYTVNQNEISRIQVIPRPEFARLRYTNTTDHVVVIRVKSTSGLFTALALPATDAGTVGLILPKGIADLSFEGGGATISKLEVYF
jgi:hypothetical protein